MSNSLSEAKRKRRNRNRFLILLLIYFMALGTAIGVTAGIKDLNTVASISIIAGVSVIYWVAFYIIIRRNNQKGN